MFVRWPLWFKIAACAGTAIVGIFTIIGTIYAVRAYHFPPSPPAQKTTQPNTEKHGTEQAKYETIKRHQLQTPSVPALASEKTKPVQTIFLPQSSTKTQKSEQPKSKSDKIEKTVNPFETVSNKPDKTFEPALKSVPLPIVYPKVVIHISGSYNRLYLKESSGTSALGRLSISGDNTQKTLYIPKGQQVHFHISGDNNYIKASDSILEFISSDGSGSNNIVQ